MQHDHHNATPSDEADKIEADIENDLSTMQDLILELRDRVKRNFQPKRLLTKRWFWIILLILLVYSQVNCSSKKKRRRSDKCKCKK